MSEAMFSEWLNQLNARMTKERRNILLFLDNATPHCEIELSNVKLKYLPPNCTCLLQPLDQGIIRSFKARYQKLLIRHLINVIDKSKPPSKFCDNITVLNAIVWTDITWQSVEKETIIKCFNHAGFKNIRCNTNETQTVPNDDSIELRELTDTINLAMSKGIQEATIREVEDTINANVATFDEHDDPDWERRILDDYLNEGIEPIESDDEPEEIETAVISTEQASSMLEELKKYFTKKDTNLFSLFARLENSFLQERIKEMMKLKQTTLDSFSN